MREFIGTNKQVATHGTITAGSSNYGIQNLTDYGHAANTHGLGEIAILGNIGGKPVVLKNDGTDAVAKSKNGIQFGVVTPTTVKWSGTIPNNPNTIVTKCINTVAVAGVKTYTIANSGALSEGHYLGILVENLNYPYYMSTKRQQLFEIRLTAAYLTSGVINSTGWSAIKTAFDAKFGSTGKNWCTMTGSNAVITITALVPGVDIKISGSNDTGIITYTSTTTAPAVAYNTGAKVAEMEKEIAVREGYNPFWTIDANLWTASSMINTTQLYVTYVIEYDVLNPGAIVIPALQRRECIVAVPKYNATTGTTANPDIDWLDKIFTALAANGKVTSDAVTGTAPSTVGAAATITVTGNGGLTFRTY